MTKAQEKLLEGISRSIMNRSKVFISYDSHFTVLSNRLVGVYLQVILAVSILLALLVQEPQLGLEWLLMNGRCVFKQKYFEFLT